MSQTTSEIGLNKDFACKHGWWAVRIRKYAASRGDIKGMEECKIAILNDFTAWIVFVALLMTVDFAALFIAPTNYCQNSNQNLVDILMFLYIASFSIAAAASVSAAYSGIHGYNFYNGIPVALLDVAIEHGKDMTHPVHYAGHSAVATMIGTTIGIYLLFGQTCVIIGSVVFGWGIFENVRINSFYARSIARMPGFSDTNDEEVP